jgi:hypothetical protein
MLGRFVKGALLTGAFALVPCASGTAFAQPPPADVAPAVTAPAAAATAPAPVAAAPAPAALPPRAPAHGAVVVALSDEAGPAARALAHEVYREPLLRPSIDEATARVLTGDAAQAAPEAAGSSARLAEITALRGSIAASVTDITTRHLLASLGSSLRADLVVAVSLDGGHAMAKVLHAGTASYEHVELGAGVEIAADGARSFKWPGAASTLRGLLPAPPQPTPSPEAAKPLDKVPEFARPVKPAHKAPPSEQGPIWKSPWFWAAIGGVAAVGVTVFVLSKTTSSTHSIHLEGSVDP